MKDITARSAIALSLVATIQCSSSSNAATSSAPGCVADDLGYHDMSAAACWELFLPTNAIDSYSQYDGASFDGRYTYFVNSQTGRVVRYDTTAAFTTAASWEGYDTTALQETGPTTYAGVLFDGRYMYFLPFSDGSVVRYDTTLPFGTASSWASFQPNPSNAIAFEGGTFDGRYLYLAPSQDSNDNDSGQVERYDTTASFTDKTSWSSFDTTTLGGDVASNAMAYDGAVFDGRYVYLAPSGLDYSVVARYDTTAPFTDKTSWEVLDTGTVSSLVDGFVGGIFDGSKVTFLPRAVSGVVLQYTIAQPFMATSSWTSHVPDPSGGGVNNATTFTFEGGAYDGRFLYFVPGTPATQSSDGVLYREDGNDAFTAATSWTSFNTTTLSTPTENASDFGSAVYDGRYLYFASGLAPGPFTRFDTKETPMQPKLPHFFGSFF